MGDAHYKVSWVERPPVKKGSCKVEVVTGVMDDTVTLSDGRCVFFSLPPSLPPLCMPSTNTQRQPGQRLFEHST